MQFIYKNEHAGLKRFPFRQNNFQIRIFLFRWLLVAKSIVFIHIWNAYRCEIIINDNSYLIWIKIYDEQLRHKTRAVE